MIRLIIYSVLGAAIALAIGLAIGIGQYIGMGSEGILIVIGFGGLSGFLIADRLTTGRFNRSIIIALVIVAGALAFLWYRNHAYFENVERMKFERYAKDSQVYTNEKYGFQFMIPNSWVVEKYPTSVDSDRLLRIRDGSKQVGGIEIEAKSKNPSVSLMDFAKDHITPKDRIEFQTQIQNIANGIPVIEQHITFKEQAGFEDLETYYFENSQNRIIVSFYGSSNVDWKTIDQILATLKLTK